MIATAATIDAVWKAAGPRDTIKLSGTFGLTRLQYKSSAKGMTLDATGAVFTDTLVINKVDGLNVIGGKFGATGGAPTKYGRAVVVYGGSNISFKQPVVVGDAGGQGIAFSDTVNATVKQGTFSGLHAAITFNHVTNGYLRSNAITGATSDGIDIADSHNVTATYNSCSAGAPAAGAHPDCIQLWSVAGHAVQSDITIEHNVATGPTQGFTSFDPAKGGGLRISIIANRVATTFSQGIACYACVDSNISYNKVTTLAGALHMTNINIIGGSDNIVIGNTIGALPKTAHLAQLALAPFDARLDASGIFDGGGAPGASVGAVPEPAAWLSMIVGFGVVGAATRRSRRLAAA
ncbi:PEPxxWA-CTERM sorting domain-containing protein [Polymorphobacter sp. PAMC 29334]|uniref:PEPxxWA-CTERM sorting domain-containing protein n=1 Tax=Polymorphobacter sp. PAMC 29334 TaxID=2862331 RepID=UPI001C73F5E8|nr:PEPxxWA-CTERM sorting domain-containing protein [Polymorphobacter sp. PAMC 29334]QYE33962.1 PEPxxWA-CTERM sorting domain-containing protein [Polymorphobacter sp. PAMC 29334]